jgi:hypothetical protein
MILNMPRRKHKHEMLRASRLSDGDAEYSFVSVTCETQIISASLWLVESVERALYNGGAAARHNRHARTGCAGAYDG